MQRARCISSIASIFLGTQAANAFLKTLEEPVPRVVFVLLGRTREGVLPTIVSRCQVVPFRHIPTPRGGESFPQVGVTPERARMAIEACDGSITQAISFAKSSERTGNVHARVMEVLAGLSVADARDVLEYAAELIERAKAPLDNVRTEQSEIGGIC